MQRVSTTTLPATSRIPAPASAPPYLGPGSWTSAEVAAHLAVGVRPARMRQVLAQWPHPGDFEDAARRGGRAFLEAGWPAAHPAPMTVPTGAWMALDGAPGYPSHLRATQSPPLVLFGLGDPAALATPGLAVVGTRQMTTYGQVVAQTAVQAIPNPYPHISGLAAGVDHASHLAALDAGIPTIAVLATGPDQIYPSEHLDLARRILGAGGAIVSEQPFGTGTDTAPSRTPAPLPARLVARNRILAGLASTVVLAEGAGRSGAMHAIWSTLAMGRHIIVAPPKPHARTIAGAQGPVALASSQPRTAAQLEAMGAPVAVRERWAGCAPLANSVAGDRDELTLMVATALRLEGTPR